MQELGIVNEWVSELIFTTLFFSFVTWTFSPFVTATKRFYTAVIYARLLMVLCGMPYPEPYPLPSITITLHPKLYSSKFS